MIIKNMIVQNSKLSRRDSLLLTVGFNLRCGNALRCTRFLTSLRYVRNDGTVLGRDSSVAALLRNDGAIALPFRPQGGISYKSPFLTFLLFLPFSLSPARQLKLTAINH
jgi:hypothetical protein